MSSQVSVVNPATTAVGVRSSSSCGDCFSCLEWPSVPSCHIAKSKSLTSPTPTRTQRLASEMPSSSGIMSDRDGLDDPLPRRCLILYSHVPDFSSPDAAQERERNIRRVVDLSNKLRERNIACRVDQYDNSSPPCNWFQWLEDQIEWCESVLLVISPAFYNAFCSRPTTPFIEQSQRDFEDVPEVELNQKLLKLACAMVAEKFGHGTSDGSNGMVPDMGIRSPRARVHPIFFDKVRPEFVPKMYCTTTSYCLPKTLSVDQPGDMRKLYAVLGQESLPETAPKPLPGNDAPVMVCM